VIKNLYLAYPPTITLSFTHERKKYYYRVFSLSDAQEPPIATIGEIGDLAKGCDTWVRYEREWKKLEIGNDEKSRPLQRHPVFRRRCLYGDQWKSDKTPKTEGVHPRIYILFSN
jgi:hypothetical protein